MIVASGRSNRHVSAIADSLLKTIKESGFPTGSIEGTGGDSAWVLVDALDVVIHIFQPEVRRLYNLEKMWAMALPEPAGALV
ncbi:Ribosomal silencing factor RsfS [compost metagenome]